MLRWGLYLIVAVALSAGSALAEPPPSTDSGQLTAKKKTAKKRTRTPKKSAKKPKKRARKRRKAPRTATVPVDLALGPAFHWMTGPIQDDQAPHYGLKLSVKAIIDKKTLQANKGRIPKQYRGMADNVSEARISPHILIPDTLYISPKTDKVGLYGINFRPYAVNVPLLRKPRLAVGVGVNVSYIYIDGEDAELGTTHFLRPGLDLAADFEIPLSDSFLISVGWHSMFFPPQEVGGDILAWGELEKSIWHIGQAYLLLHFRFPYTTAL